MRENRCNLSHEHLIIFIEITHLEQIGGYALQTTTKIGFDNLLVKVAELLKEEGFGILTEIDVKETMKKKLDIDYKPFRILGACNPVFAHRSLGAVPQISVLLPCNVVVWDDGDHRVVAMMEPTVMSRIIDNTEIKSVATEVSAKLHRVIEKIEKLNPDA